MKGVLGAKGILSNLKTHQQDPLMMLTHRTKCIVKRSTLFNIIHMFMCQLDTHIHTQIWSPSHFSIYYCLTSYKITKRLDGPILKCHLHQKCPRGQRSFEQFENPSLTKTYSTGSNNDANSPCKIYSQMIDTLQHNPYVYLSIFTFQEGFSIPFSLVYPLQKNK